MNIHPCLDKYLFQLIAQVYMNTEYRKIPGTKMHKKPSSRSQVFPCGWAGGHADRERQTGRKSAVPFTNGLTNVLYATKTIYPQRVVCDTAL